MGYTRAQSPIFINEILADPDGTNGDANGDGVVSSTQDEFVELVNVSGSFLDVSGWTLSDASGVRHTFPAGSVVCEEGVMVVFSGGTPAGTFGGARVQTASTGQLGLNNAGDTVTLRDGVNVIASYTYGAEGGDNQSLTRDPDVTGPEPLIKHALAADATGRRQSPGIRVNGTSFLACPILTKEIFEIQGSGLVSPFATLSVTTEQNLVIALSANGFFMQTPASRSDNDSQTSDGIFVFTGSAPTVNVGDLVNVTGQVFEFFNFTEFSNNPSVTLVSSGNALPPAVQLDGSMPSASQPQSATEFERWEGMLVEISFGVVCASNQVFGSDPVAEVFIVAGPNRPFREPGIVFPGLPGLPVWDGNPELLELDLDRLGQPNAMIPAGCTFSATGVIGFEFGDYEFWPVQYSVNTLPFPRAVRPRNSGEITVATLNMHRFFDDVDDPNLTEPVPSALEYANKLNKFSLYIRTLLDAPEILAVEEAENLNALQDLANRIQSDDAALVYAPYLAEGNDIGGIDVGFLVRNTVAVNAVTQLGATELFSLDNSRLHDRPPLLLDATLPGGQALSVVALHMRSLNGIDDAAQGPRVRQKRHEQAVSVANMIQGLQNGDPNIRLVITGDFNAFQFTDGYVDVLGQIMGTPANASQALIPGTDLVNPDLINKVQSLPADEQYSFVFAGSAQVLDHMLVSQALDTLVSGIQYARANADAAEILEPDGTTALRSSDHDGLVLYIVALQGTAVGQDRSTEAHRLPEAYALEQNYPNPFNPATVIGFALPMMSKISLTIYSTSGGRVRQLMAGEMAAGYHNVTWDARDDLGVRVASGVYLCLFKAGNFVAQRKLVLMK
ncbi:MAG: lamin tail domain-containing protein [bacterium]